MKSNAKVESGEGNRKTDYFAGSAYCLRLRRKSNIDPLSLLLNLEANVVVRDAEFAQALAARFEAAFAVSAEVTGQPAAAGWRGWMRRAFVACSKA